MAEPEAIVGLLAEAFGASPTGAPPSLALAGKTVLVTAGPTREPLDPIRFLSNRSSGKMGIALAAEAARRGARVVLVHGPLAAPVPDGIERRPAETAREMLAAVQSVWNEVDVAVFAAAVANFEAPSAKPSKIKEAERLSLELVRTPDIAAWCGEHRRPGQCLVGFAAETEDLIASARRKLERKRLDLVCANAIGDPALGFAAEENRVWLVDGAAEPAASPALPKPRLAAWIWDRLEPRLAGAQAGTR
jgi:phosphopantothenoylcysteine decarboxylase/phosphopantothenate--cysteine ligase